MPKGISFSKLNAKNLKVGIVISRWNSQIVDGLLEGCQRALTEAGVSKKNIVSLDVPGSFELPFAAQKIIRQMPGQKKVDVVVVLGCLIKGETRHDEYIGLAVNQGIMRVGLDSGVPVVFGVLTCETEKQAIARSTGDNNHGYFWGKTGVEMGLLKKKK